MRELLGEEHNRACAHMCVWQEGAGDVLFHGEDTGQHAGRLWDEVGEGSPGAAQQTQWGEVKMLHTWKKKLVHYSCV